MLYYWIILNTYKTSCHKSLQTVSYYNCSYGIGSLLWRITFYYTYHGNVIAGHQAQVKIHLSLRMSMKNPMSFQEICALLGDLYGLTSTFCCCSLVYRSSYYPPVVISFLFCRYHTHKYHLSSLWALLPLLKFWRVVRSVLRFCFLKERESHPLTTFGNLRFRKEPPVIQFSSV